MLYKGTSREKIYQELGLESLRARIWYKRLSCMFKIVKEEAPNYLINLIPKIQQTTKTRINRMPTFHYRKDCLKNFFSFTLNDWYKFDETIRNSESISIFKSRLLSFIRPLESSVYNIFDPIGLKCLTRLRLGFSHHNGHRFRYNFRDDMNPLCSCRLEIEDTSHYLLHYHHFSQCRIYLMNSVKSALENIGSLSSDVKRDILLYGDSRLDRNKNKFILEATLAYIKSTFRFSGAIFN